MKILIASDSHDRWEYLEEAVDKGNAAGCEAMLFAGDFMSPTGVYILKKFNGPVHFVFGNNEGEIVGLTRSMDASENIKLHYKFGESIFTDTIDGLSFYMNHYPKVVRNAALTGEYDVCVYGHDHIYHEETLENGTILLNPGEIQGFKTGKASCMIFDTETKSGERIEIGE